MPFLRKYTGPLKTAVRKQLSAIAIAVDAYFNYVTLLLQGDGTNGAQNNTFLDSSTNNYTITRNGNTTQGSFSPYGSNWSNYFGGSSSITAPDSSAFDYGSGDFTLECWIYPTTTNSSVLLTAQTSGSIYGPCNLFFSSGALELYSSSNNSSFDVASGASVGTPAVNQWSHVAVSRSGTSIRCFLNGTVTSTTTSSATLMNATGTFQIASRNGSEFYSGYVSNFRVVKGTAVYTAAFTPPTAPLTAISGTSLLTCADNRFLDDSTNNFTLTAIGTPSVQRFNPFGTATAYSTAVIGGSGYFDGTGDNLSFANGAGFDARTGNFTIECWVYPNSTSQSGIVGNLTNNNGLVQWQIFINYAPTNKQVGFLYGTSASYLNNVFVAGNTGTLASQSWYHIAVTRSGSTIRVFLNGLVVDTDTTGNSFFNNNPNSFVIGSHADSSEFTNGYITDVRVIQGTALYTSAFTPPTAPLTAVSGTSVLTNMTNGAIFDNAMMNNLETVGNAQISTSVYKYGTGSLAFDGTGDYLYRPNSDLFAFGTGDFTVEFWMYANSTANDKTLMGTASGYTTGGWQVGFNIDGQQANGIEFLIEASPHVYVFSGALSTATWYHVAATRSGTTLRLFINGTQVSSTTSSNNISDSAGNALAVGRTIEGIGSRDYNGYIDDLRITKGYARYTANFTAPTAAFFNTGPT